VSAVRYELGFYIPEDGFLHSHCAENLRSYSVVLAERLVKETNEGKNTV
jgi:hypothetical protein